MGKRRLARTFGTVAGLGVRVADMSLLRLRAYAGRLPNKPTNHQRTPRLIAGPRTTSSRQDNHHGG